MSSSVEDQSLLELLALLGRGVPELVRKEIELVKQEAARVLDRTQGAVLLVVLATAFCIATVSLLLLAMVGAVAILLVAYGIALPVAATLAALIVGLLGGSTSALLVWLGVRSLREARASIDETVAAFAQDVPTAAEKAR